MQKHNPKIDWQTGEMKMRKCPRECDVFVRKTKKEKKVKREKRTLRKYLVSMKEVPDEEMPNGDDLIMMEEDD